MNTTNILIDLGSLLHAVAGMLAAIAAATGVVMVIAGLFAAFIADRNKGGFLSSMGTSGGLVFAAAGSLLVALNSWLGVLSVSVFSDGGADPEAYLVYQVSSGPNPAAVMMSLIVLSLNVLGAYAVMKGTYMLGMMGAASQNSASSKSIWSCLVFLIAGTFGANFLTFTDYVAGQFHTANATRQILAGGL